MTLGVSWNPRRIADQLTQKLIISQTDGAQNAINILDGVTDQEKKLLAACTEGLKGNIEKGINFIKNPPK